MVELRDMDDATWGFAFADGLLLVSFALLDEAELMADVLLIVVVPAGVVPVIAAVLAVVVALAAVVVPAPADTDTDSDSTVAVDVVVLWTVVVVITAPGAALLGPA
ncbi:MAG: hypothetical protein Q9227_007423 [Pyrenula ochraceoflavens]